jgi:hypothetical protein
MAGMEEDSTSPRTLLWIAIATTLFVVAWFVVVRIAQSNRDPSLKPEPPNPWRYGSSPINP